MKIFSILIIIGMLFTGCTTYKGSIEFPVKASKSGLTDGYQEYTVTLQELYDNTITSNNWVIVLYNQR